MRDHPVDPDAAAGALEPMSVDECFMKLDHYQRGVGRIATAAGRPVIMPVNYVMDGEDVIIRTAAGTKLNAAVEGQRVAFEIDSIPSPDHTTDEHGEAWSVLVRGIAARVADPDEITRLNLQRLQPSAGGAKPHYIRITTEQISGRRF